MTQEQPGCHAGGETPAALAESLARYRRIVETTQEGIWEMDGQFITTYVNQQMAALLGYEPAEMLGHSVTDFMLVEEMDDHQAKMERRRQGLHERYERQFRRRDGSSCWMLVSATALQDAQGNFAGSFAMLTDITARKQAEAALRQGEARYRELFEDASVGIFQSLPQGRYRLVNRAFAAMFGYTSPAQMVAEVTDIAAQLYASAEDRVRFSRLLLEQGALVNHEVRLRRRDGTPFWGSINATAVYDEQGQVQYYHGTLINITERKQAEAALYESEARQRQILEAVPVAIVLSRVEDGTILYANHYASSLFGLPVAELVGRSMVDLYGSVADRERLLQELAQRGRVQDYEFRVRRLDQGAGRWVSLAAQPLSYQGAPVWLSSLVDITDRKQAEQEREQLLVQLREQAQQRQQIINTVPEGILFLVVDETKQYCVQLANLLGEKDLAFLAQVRVGEYLSRLGGQPLACFLTSPPKGLWHELEYGGRIFQLIARSLQDQPLNGSWVLVIRDITQQRDTERRIQQQERLAAVGQLAAGIAHDFNNILAVIGLYAQLMVQDTTLSPRVRERLAIINQEAQHASRLIQQILDFSRRTILERRPLDLLPLFKEQLKILERTLPESIRLSLVHAADTYMVNGDPTRLQQLLMNLALNARDAMPEGGGLRVVLERLTITAAQSQGKSPLPPLAVPFPAPLPPELTAGEWIRITVADTGAGLSPEAQAHLFQPFFTTKEPGKGTGLGLAQVHGIVGAHEGYIVAATCSRQAGQPGGTAFVIYLPALVVPAAGEALAAPADLPAGHGEVVLVVEDNAAARAALVDSLTALGYRAVTAGDGLQALEFLQRAADQIVLVLSDVVMPELGGLGLLRAMYRQGYRIGVILLTGHPLQQELEQLRGEGDPAVQALLVDWLLKPPSLEQLAQTLAQALAARR
jgi:PAS domain S-box-containing protein